MGAENKSIDSRLARSRAWHEIMAFYRYLKPGLWLMNLPFIGAFLQKIAIQEGNDANWFIPLGETLLVGENIPTGKQHILPGEIVEILLREADGIFAMAACPCRTAFKCQEHPWDLGCLHLGPATKAIPTDVGCQLSLDEGLAHLEKALAGGLIPTILHIPSEAEIFRVDKTRLLSICFCCECCCDVRLMLRTGPDRYWDLYNQKLPGLSILVGDGCTLCGECITACYGGERVITLGARKAEIHERCLGCGRCILACPNRAITIQFDPGVDVIESLLERIRTRVEIGAAGAGSVD